jgi:hypothetical protein
MIPASDIESRKKTQEEEKKLRSRADDERTGAKRISAAEAARRGDSHLRCMEKMRSTEHCRKSARLTLAGRHVSCEYPRVSRTQGMLLHSHCVAGHRHCYWANMCCAVRRRNHGQSLEYSEGTISAENKSAVGSLPRVSLLQNINFT